MYIGEIVAIGNSYFVHIPSAPTKQKVYPLSSISALNILDNQESKIVECELIPNNQELDEQVEYTARIINPLNPTKNEKNSQ
jgi:hypothetical protein